MNTTTVTAKYNPATGEIYPPDQPTPIIDTTLIPPLQRRLIGATFYNSMMRFYDNPDNMRRFEAWQRERKESQLCRNYLKK